MVNMFRSIKRDRLSLSLKDPIAFEHHQLIELNSVTREVLREGERERKRERGRKTQREISLIKLRVYLDVHFKVGQRSTLV